MLILFPSFLILNGWFLESKNIRNPFYQRRTGTEKKKEAIGNKTI